MTNRLPQGSEHRDCIATLSHEINDSERMRTMTVRILTANLLLLNDGLHALRHGSPDVTDEFLDRTVLALTALRSRLTAGTDR